MFLLLLRKLWIRRRRSNTDKSSTSSTTPEELKFQEKELHLPEIIMTTTPHHDETDQIVNQLAALAATASNTSSNNAPSSTAAPIAEPQSAIPKPKLEQPEEEESFYHLRSLITVSCLPHHTPSHTSTPSASTLGSKSGKRKSQIFDRKRASSILSLHLGDLPSLPFSSKGKVSCKPRPRYTPLPPPFVQKRLAIRPEVRF
ncbi:hypothetical protein N7471_005132 [Penicillium samsonianum]|uniref:uncharacterized protein n=1 Tax=Penicillium samsonianum TaxID=1882272 RepID=UPI002547300F|nr:uncharacterized protein N7471_005132 [Penicillium samsonianum]KAJ6138646.1 hypothetical protein N7471_005132 [Penicillium samsonianum]